MIVKYCFSCGRRMLLIFEDENFCYECIKYVDLREDGE